MELLNYILLFGLALTTVTWLSPAKWQQWIILAGTVLFLALKAPVSLVILSLTTLSSYWIFKAPISLTAATLLVIFQNIIIFVVYKMGAGHALVSPADRFIPLGLSYYSFRQIHYAIEQYKGKIGPHQFGDYAAYLFFLPTILIGPINRFSPFLRNIYRRRWDATLFSEGLERILYGYAKIVIIGNFLLTNKLSGIVATLEENHLWLSNYLRVLNYTLNTYFQFAGYSDVAIGMALLLGFRVMENFNYPFLAPNINEFWNRWHISLSSWCRDYVYTPMASITRKPIVGILMTMLVIALWHEISGRYIIWGVYHGLGIAVWHLYHRSSWRDKLKDKLPGYKYLAILLTFHFVLFSFVIVKEESWGAMWETYRILFGEFSS
ncbi:MAG: MBOAT family O-acyltransferase [Saprospiraceae bacterium]|nr:MBOAT family protein [Lewinella sp.]